MKINKRLPIIITVSIGVIGILIGFNMTKNNERLPVYAPTHINPRLVDSSLHLKSRGHFISDFELINQNGETVTGERLKDKIYVADFFFTTCPTICPKMADQMGRVYKKFYEDPEIMLVSHTVQPEVDSVEVLKEYAELHNADISKWIFLTGDKKQIYDLARKSYFAAVTEGDGGVDDFIHTENFVLVDKNKMIRGFYDGTSEEDVDRLIADIEILKREYES